MQTEIVRCPTWSAFKTEMLQRLFGREPFKRGQFIFRGQRSSEWRLKPSFDRWFEGLDLPESARIAVAERLLEEFQRQGKDLHFDSELTRDQSIALAQHYGLPTRLL